MGLTKEGYQRRTYDEILAGKIEKAKELFGEDIDTSSITPLGKFIRIEAYDLAEAEETMELIYYARFPNTAFGTSLDRLCPFVGISRNSAMPAQYKATVTGEANTVVPIGFLVSTDAEVTYWNTAESVIGEEGTCEIEIECTEAGEIGNVNYIAINQIVNPTIGIDSVVGIELLKAGEDEESDYALRKRFSQAIEGSGACNENALRASLLRVPTVTSASVITNETDVADEDGRPPRSFQCYVAGGEDYHDDIAKAIYDKKPLGIKTHGDISVEVLDEGGFGHTIMFSHVTVIGVSVLVRIKTNASYEGEDGAKEITENLTTVIDNLGVGNPVILSTLYGNIHSVAGVEEVYELKLSTDGGSTYAAENVITEIWEVAKCVDVTVEVI